MYVNPKDLEKLREIGALSFLLANNRHELIADGYNRYRLRNRHSLVISPKGWYAWDDNVGGKSAIDLVCYLENVPLVEACRIVGGTQVIDFQHYARAEPENGEVALPPKNESNKRVFDYLKNRRIDGEIINYCIEKDILYEEKQYGSCVFVGWEQKYAFVRGIYSNFKQEVKNSQKAFSFRIIEGNNTLNVFESAIDALSFATLLKNAGQDWKLQNYLSLGGVSDIALKNELSRNKFEKVHFCLDNDRAGLMASQKLKEQFESNYEVKIYVPKSKDWNEQLTMKGAKNYAR